VKLLIFLIVLLISIYVCGLSFSSDITGTYTNQRGTIIIEKSYNNYIVRGKAKKEKWCTIEEKAKLTGRKLFFEDNNGSIDLNNDGITLNTNKASYGRCSLIL